jgi:hypothetical protein
MIRTDPRGGTPYILTRHILVHNALFSPIPRFLSVWIPKTLKAYIWRDLEAHFNGDDRAPNARSHRR